MKNFLGFLFFSAATLLSEAQAELVKIPDPVEINSVTNAIFDVKTDIGGEFRFYFVALPLHDKCLKDLEKAKEKYAEIQSSGEVDENQFHPRIVLNVSDYTFVTGDYEGETVKKVTSCRVQKKPLRLILKDLRPSAVVKILKKLKDAKDNAESQTEEVSNTESADEAAESSSSTLTVGNRGILNKRGIGNARSLKIKR